MSIKTLFGILTLTLFIPLFSFSNPFTTTTINSTDGLHINVDIYESNPGDPVILMFHQAGYSRGEYREIAPKLVTLGFNCLAIDQRSGGQINGVINETHKQAVDNKLPTGYPDALPDLEAALAYAKSQYPNSKIIIWGSSYSASLNFILAQKHTADIDGILCFSPGEYFEYDFMKIADYAIEVNCPIFITSSKSEVNSWKPIYENIPIPEKVTFTPTHNGYHGSKALWSQNQGNQEYWDAVTEFLTLHFL